MTNISSRAWLAWGLGAAFFFFEYLLQVSPSVMAPDLMRAFHADGSMIGNLSAFYFYSYAIIQVPAGVLLDRFGSRRLLTTATLICTLGTFIFALTSHLGVAQIGRTLIGLGSGFAVIGTMNLAARWFPPQRFALLAGITVSIGMLGAIAGQAPLSLLVEFFSWRESLMILVALGMVLAIFMWIFVRDQPKKAFIDPNAVKQAPLLEGLVHILRNRQAWLTALYGGLMFAPTSAFCSLWGVPFLMSAYHYSRPTAAGLISIVFLGWVVGSPFFGWFSDYLGRRKPTMTIGAIGAFITLSISIFIPMNLISLGIMLFLFGFFTSGFFVSFSLIREINPPQYSATSLGFMNMINMLGGSFGLPFIGVILDHQWTGTMQEGARVFSVHAYHIALIALPAVILLSLLILPFIKETYCRSTHSS